MSKKKISKKLPNKKKVPDPKKKFIKCKKEFLNLNDSNGGYISAVGYYYEVPKANGRPFDWSEGTLRITDCNTTINLDLDFHTEEAYNNSMHKLQVLRDVILDATYNLTVVRKEFVNRKSKEDREGEIKEI